MPLDLMVPVTVGRARGNPIHQTFAVAYPGMGLMVTDIIIINGAGFVETNATVSESVSGAVLAQLLTVVDGGSFYWEGGQWFGYGSQIDCDSSGAADVSMLVTGYLAPDTFFALETG
jgi:hypothetical protein